MHRLLKRQIKRTLGELEVIPAGWEKFLAAVSDAYDQFDNEQRMLERTVELNSKELLELTSQIRAAIPDTFLRLDTKGTILDYKESHNKNSYLLSSDVIGHQLKAFLPKLVSDKFLAAITFLEEQNVSEVSIFHELLCEGREHHYEVRLLPLLDNQIIAIVRDITERKLAEAKLQRSQSRLQEETKKLARALTDLQQTQEQLIQTEKMSSLGQMVAGIAHEINNPIGFIHSNIYPLQDYFEDLCELLNTYQSECVKPTKVILDKQKAIDLDFILEDSSALLKSMQMGTQRVRDIVLSLRNYSRLDEANIKEIDLHEGLESTLLILSHRFKCGVEVIKNYGLLPKVRCSPAQINQVYTHIIGNALDAMLAVDYSPKQLILTTRVMGSNTIQISICDNGIGISPDIKPKIFDPFFTTKQIGEGTGLGLGICFKIIQQHQGSIEVHSEVGKGTEFIITLPSTVDDRLAADNRLADDSPNDQSTPAGTHNGSLPST